jgi:hypothetical protein
MMLKNQPISFVEIIIFGRDAVCCLVILEVEQAVCMKGILPRDDDNGVRMKYRIMKIELEGKVVCYGLGDIEGHIIRYRR